MSSPIIVKTATGQFVSGRTRLLQVAGHSAVTFGSVTFHDGTDATGKIKYKMGLSDNQTLSHVFKKGILFKNGIFVALSGTSPKVMGQTE